MQITFFELEPNDRVRHKITGECFRVSVILRETQALVTDDDGFTHSMSVKELEFLPPDKKSGEKA